MADLFGGHGGEQGIGADPWIRGARRGEQDLAVLAPELVRAGTQPGPWAGGLRHRDEVQVRVDVAEVGLGEGGQPVGGRGARAERRGAGEQHGLQFGLTLIEEGRR